MRRRAPGRRLVGLADGFSERHAAGAGLALLLADHYGYVLGPTLADDRAALDRALEAARSSMDIDGNGMLGNLALARVQ